MNLLSTVLILSCLPSALIDFALPKWKTEPDIRIEDVYKWTYQAIRGGEHAAPSRETAATWLEREWRSLGKKPADEPLWEPLCPDGEIGRLNLRAFRDLNGNPHDLLTAFLTSSRDYRSEPAHFMKAWSEIGRRLRKEGAGKVTFVEWERLDIQMKLKDYPAIHHSSDYKNARQPAYRIITTREKEKLFSGLKH